MPVDPLEEAREKIIREAVTRTRNLSNYPHHARQAQAETIIAETGAALAELDCRSPPTKGVDPGCGFIDCVNECGGDFTHATCPHVRALKRLTIAARTSGGTAGPDTELMAACAEAEAALAAAPPPPDVSRGLEVEQQYSSKSSAFQPALGGKLPLDEPESAAGAHWPLSVEDFVAGYEFRGDGFDHMPTTDECALLADALHGFKDATDRAAASQGAPDEQR